MSNTSAKRHHIARAMAGAAVFSVAWVGLGLHLISPPLEEPSTGDRMALAALCLSLAAIPLLLSIASLAAGRFFSAADIDGGAPATGSQNEVNQRVLVNTAEQSLLIALVYPGVAQMLPAQYLQALPVLTALFVLARVLFWIGYHRSPSTRAFGFAATFYPTVGAALTCAWLIGERLLG